MDFEGKWSRGVVPVVVVALVLGGCVVKPPDSRMGEAGMSAPGAWTATKQAKAGVDTNWVARFGDRGLVRMVDEALAANPDLRASAERVKRAAALAKASGAAARPQAGVGLLGSRQEQKYIGLPIGGGTDPLSSIYSSYGSSLNVSWEPDLWGKVRAGERAAVADLEAQGWAYRGARASLGAEVARAWLALAEANEQVALANKVIKVRSDTVETISDRFARALAGEGGTAAELRLAQADRASAEATLAQREGERDSAIRRLEVLLGRYPSGQLTGSAKLPSVPKRPPAGLPSELLLRRPDILAAERQFAASGQRVKEARLAFYPSFSLTGSLGTVTNQLKSVLDSDFGVWSIVGQLSQPILAGGTLKSQLEARRAEDREAVANLQGVVLKGFGEVETALAADAYLAAQEKATATAVARAVEASEAAVEDYAGGTGDVLTMLAAQSRAVLLSSQQLSLRRLRLENRVNLHLALGGDYKPSSK